MSLNLKTNFGLPSQSIKKMADSRFCVSQMIIKESEWCKDTDRIFYWIGRVDVNSNESTHWSTISFFNHGTNIWINDFYHHRDENVCLTGKQSEVLYDLSKVKCLDPFFTSNNNNLVLLLKERVCDNGRQTIHLVCHPTLGPAFPLQTIRFTDEAKVWVNTIACSDDEKETLILEHLPYTKAQPIIQQQAQVA